MSIPPIPAHLQLQIVSADRSLVNEQDFFLAGGIDEVVEKARLRKG